MCRPYRIEPRVHRRHLLVSGPGQILPGVGFEISFYENDMSPFFIKYLNIHSAHCKYAVGYYSWPWPTTIPWRVLLFLVSNQHNYVHGQSARRRMELFTRIKSIFSPATHGDSYTAVPLFLGNRSFGDWIRSWERSPTTRGNVRAVIWYRLIFVRCTLELLLYCGIALDMSC
jgi:hypothetical protein